MPLLLSTTIAGLAAGAAYALLGLSNLLTYRLAGVANFTQTAVGAFGAFTMVALNDAGVPLPVAVVTGVLVGAALHTAVGGIMVAWFAEGRQVVKAAVTIMLFAAIVAFGNRVFGASTVGRFPDPFAGIAFHLGGVNITWTAVITTVLAVGATVGCVLFLGRTRLGLKLRALSERPTTAALSAIPAGGLALGVWAVGGAVTTLTIILVAPLFPTDYMSLSYLITQAFAAALIGGFRSFPLTLAGGFALGALGGLASSLTVVAQYRPAIPLIVILVVLLWSQRRARWEIA
ncbi:branched-chain amino acid ABC transporter permease [Streptosporangium saharense]|uniref:branched-chain amino acid ABC transporter permease n=1 Tax=Streptosporangium saharense TaxID=1706840 RepID=UPI0036BD422B